MALKGIGGGGEPCIKKTTVNLADHFKEDLQTTGVTWRGAERVASDRSWWKKLVPDVSEGSGGTESKSLR